MVLKRLPLWLCACLYGKAHTYGFFATQSTKYFAFERFCFLLYICIFLVSFLMLFCNIFDRIDCFSISVFVCFTCEIVTATANRLRCLGYSANFPITGSANTNETVQHVDDLHPLSPMACGIHDPVSSGLLSSNAHNNTNKENGDKHHLIFKILAVAHIFSVECPINYLQACHICTKEWCKFTTATWSLAFIAHLIVQYVWLYFDPFINVTVLQLHKTCRYGSDVALLIRKCHTTSTLYCSKNHKILENLKSFRCLEECYNFGLPLDIWAQDQYRYQHSTRHHTNGPWSLPVQLFCSNKIKEYTLVPEKSLTMHLFLNERSSFLPAFNGRGTPAEMKEKKQKR